MTVSDITSPPSNYLQVPACQNHWKGSKGNTEVGTRRDIDQILTPQDAAMEAVSLK